MTKKGGTYALVLAMKQEVSVSVGRLGDFCFLSGYYIYVGSALGSIEGRLKHHFREAHHPHWHIDYLMPHCHLVDVWYGFSSLRRECDSAKAVAGLPEARIVIPRFGASDCRCPSHLFYLPKIPSFQAFREALSRSDAVAQTGGGFLPGSLSTPCPLEHA